jgi:Flp pilus assembly protein TadB
MPIINVFAVILVIVGLFFLLGLTPDVISRDILSFVHKKESLSYKAAIVQGRAKRSKLRIALSDMHNALKATGSENKFAVLLTLSLLGFAGGCVIAAMINNIIFVPVFAVISFTLPYGYAKGLAAVYNKQISEELETALSVITTAYMANEDIIFAVENSVEHIRQPVQQVFKEFLAKTKLINSNVRLAISQMKNSINNEVFHEWCENLIECQDNITLKHTLQPITSRLADIRVVNVELSTMLMNPRREFLIMMLMTIGNFPMLLLLNRDWGIVLFNTMVGQIVLGITAIVCIITTILCFKFTQPIEFRR